MKKSNFMSSPVTDLEILQKNIIYLSSLSLDLPCSRLRHHCKGAMASLYELYFYLSSHNLNDYGNNKK